MSYLVAAPELLASAATDLEGIGTALTAANGAAAAPTTVLSAAGLDEVSEAITAFFARHAQEYQALGARVSAFHQQFVQAMTAGADRMRPPRRLTPRRCRASGRTCWVQSMPPPRRCFSVT